MNTPKMKNTERSKLVYRELMDGKHLTSKQIPNLSDTLANMKRKGVKFSSERMSYGSGKIFFMTETDKLINRQNEK